MPDLYEALQVPPTASAETIKKAFRRRAKKTHPDRGGSSEEFALVVAAYHTLVDPAARAQYDRTGQIPSPSNLEKEASAVLVDLFSKLLDRAGGQARMVDLITKMKEGVSLRLTKYHANVQKMKEVETVIAELQPRAVHTGAGPNLLTAVIIQKLQLARAELVANEHEIKVAEKVAALLDEYRWTYDTAFQTLQTWRLDGVTQGTSTYPPGW